MHAVSDSCSVLGISRSFSFERLKVSFVVLRQCWWERLVLEPHVTHAALQFEALGFVGCEVLTAVTVNNVVGSKPDVSEQHISSIFRVEQ